MSAAAGVHGFRVPPRSAGFGVVEILVAVAIGLLVVAGAVTMLVSSKTTYTTQDSLARLQENARFAVEFMTRDLRMTGYFGCADNLLAVSSTLNSDAGDLWEITHDPGTGRARAFDAYEHSATVKQWRPSQVAVDANNMPTIENNTDAVALRFIDGTTTPLRSTMTNPAGVIEVTSPSGFVVGDVLAISDCLTAHIFQVTAITTEDGLDKLSHAKTTTAVKPGNAKAELGATKDTPDGSTIDCKTGKCYALDTAPVVGRFRAVRYYIAKSDTTNLRGLYRQSLSNPTPVNGVPTVQATAGQELVSGIENLQMLYGIDTDDDRVPNVYVTADAVSGLTSGWANVIAVRVGLLGYSIANTEYQADGKVVSTGDMIGKGKIAGEDQFRVNGTLLKVSDGTLENRQVQRRVFHETVSLRNNR